MKCVDERGDMSLLQLGQRIVAMAGEVESSRRAIAMVQDMLGHLEPYNVVGTARRTRERLDSLEAEVALYKGYYAQLASVIGYGGERECFATLLHRAKIRQNKRSKKTAAPPIGAPAERKHK